MAETCTEVSFTSGVNTIGATVGVEINQNLNSLLSCAGTGQLTWSTIGTFPSWLTLNSQTGVLTGMPTATNLGVTTFSISASSSESGGITQIQINVSDAPVWSLSNINLGIQTVSVAWSFNLNTVVTDPLGGSLSFSAQNLPSWMSLTPQGMLSGTPTANSVGVYSGIIFTATASGGSSTANGFGLVVPAGAQLVLAGPATISSNTCRAFTVTAENGSDQAFNLSSATTIQLQLSNAAASTTNLYSSSSCSGNAISSLSIPAGNSSATFYMLGDATGIVSTQAATPGFASGTLNTNIVAAGSINIVLSGPTQGIVGTCIPVNLGFQDGSGIAWIPSSDVTSQLSSGQSDVTFYMDSMCTTTITNVSIPANGANTTFYVAGTVASNKNIMAASTGFVTGSLSLNLSAGAPNTISLSSPNSVIWTNACTPIQIQLLDQFGNNATASASLVSQLAAGGGAALGTQFFSDAQCSQVSATNTIAAGSASSQFYMEDSVSGVLTVTAVPSSISPATIAFTVNAQPNFSFLGGNNLNFGNVSVNTVKVLPLTLQNSGGPGTLSSISITGATFSIVSGGTCQANMSLAAGATCTIQVQFAPTSAASQTGAVSVVSNVGNETSNLTGTGVIPASFVWVGSNSLNFGQVTIGQSSVLPLTVQNSGGAGAFPVIGTPSAVQFTVLSTGTCQSSQTIAAGASCTIQVQYKPTAVETDSATLSIGSLASTMTGSGIAAPSFNVVGGNNINFGQVLINTTQSATVTLSNTGGAGTLTSEVLSGADYKQAATTCQPNEVLQANSSCTVTVSFTPVGAGQFAGSLSFATNAGTVNVAITGQGVTMGALSFNPASLNFGQINTGSSATACATVTNIGGADVVLGAMGWVAAGPYTTIAMTACGVAPCASGMRLSSQSSCSIDVQFAPVVGGSQPDWINIQATSAGDPITVNYAVTGSGYQLPPCSTAVNYLPAHAKVDFILGDGAPGDAPYPKATAVYNTNLGYQCGNDTTTAVWSIPASNPLVGKAGDNRYYTLECTSSGMSAAKLACTLVQAPPGGVKTITISKLSCTSSVSADQTFHVSCTYGAYHPNHGQGKGTFNIDSTSPMPAPCGMCAG